MTRLRDRYQTKVVPELKKALRRENVHALPKVVKIVLNVGLSRAAKDPNVQQTVLETLTRITGQKPVLTKARQSIASFKLRQGQIIGAMVTLRGKRMEEFLDKLIHVTLPRVRDFRGLRKQAVAAGTLTIGFKEHTVFPEIRSDEVDRLHGLEVTIVTTATRPEETLALLTALGMPFSDTAVEEPEGMLPSERAAQRASLASGRAAAAKREKAAAKKGKG
ncbi:MAG: 50S ribosomal protein L5 [Candidatus Kerfeldbacteria bacterium]|nr:50S ribosomal protein L5 [Candidatus Kerfeldbacteria bacterium]